MILIDANSLIILILGLMDPRIINSHPRTLIYDEKDFHLLIELINHDLSNLQVLPNVWTEVDNLLNNFGGSRKWTYIEKFKFLTDQLNEKYITSVEGANSDSFMDLGLTDVLLLECAKDCTVLITSDSKLSDYAIANGVKVIDLVKERNLRL